MFTPNRIIFTLSVFTLFLGAICQAESNQQLPAANDSASAQIQLLQNQLMQVNNRIAVLESGKSSTLQLSGAQGSATNSAISGRAMNHPHGR